MTTQYAFYIDQNSCIGCKACQMACIDKNDLELGQLWRRVYEYTGGDWIKNGNIYNSTVYTYYTSISCQHCETPLCVEVCPSEAMHKRDDGIVLVETEECLGCRYCEWVCPYHAPQFNPSIGKMGKCNFCYDLLAQGDSPACVEACPMRAMDFGELDELIAKYGDMRDPAPLPDKKLTHPSVIFTPHHDGVRAETKPGQVANQEEV